MSIRLTGVSADDAAGWAALCQRAAIEGVRITAQRLGATGHAYRIDSKGTEYRVDITMLRDGCGLMVSCTCEAGRHNQRCKHAALVLHKTGRWWAIDPTSDLALINHRQTPPDYRYCPHCLDPHEPLVATRHERNGVYERRYSCVVCGWLRWEGQIAAEIAERDSARSTRSAVA